MDNTQAILQFFAHVYEEKIKTIISQYEEQKKQRQYQSNEINELAAALSKTQAEMPMANLGSVGHFKNKYADLAEIIRASRHYLSKNGLSVTQQIIPGDDGIHHMLHTTLMHSSGQWIKSLVRLMPPKDDIQSLASYITYMRRYSYSALVGIAADEDDDATKAMGQKDEFITHGQCEFIEKKLKERPDLSSELKELLQIDNFTKMKKDTYAGVMKWIEEYTK